MLSLRVRLALWSTTVLVVTLTTVSVVVYLTVQHTLLTGVDTVISGRAQRAGVFLPIHTHPPYLTAADVQSTLDTFSSPDVFLQVTDPRGVIVARSTALAAATLPVVRPSLTAAATGQPAFATATGSGGLLRLYVTPLYSGPTRTLAGFLIVARSLASPAETLAALRGEQIAAGIVAVILASAVTLILAERALRPVATMTTTARQIAVSANLSKRVPYAGPRDVVGTLALTFNDMLASLEAVSAAQKRFVADASHELRAPLTTILGNAEALLRRPDTPVHQREEALSDIVEEGQRLSRLVGALLALARADAGQQLVLCDIWLDRLLLDTVARMAAARPEAALRIARVEPVWLRGDDDRLIELIVILLDNALKYAPLGSPIDCALSREGSTILLTVEDQGMGIDTADLPHIFERFYRAAAARSHEEAGTGLGLAIAAWIVEQHHGQITVQSVPGQGSTFTVALPAATPT